MTLNIILGISLLVSVSANILAVWYIQKLLQFITNVNSIKNKMNRIFVEIEELYNEAKNIYENRQDYVNRQDSDKIFDIESEILGKLTKLSLR